jgi:methyl-accepting chemotaxis protein
MSRLFPWLKRLTMAQSAIVMSLALVLCTAFAIGVVSLSVLQSKLKQRIIEEQAKDARMAVQVLKQFHPETQYSIGSGRVTRIVMPQIPTFSDHAIVDAIGAVTGETVTLFAWDAAAGEFVRKTTNVMGSGGTRAIGTALDKNGPVHRAVLSNDIYKGEATILGIPYYTEYDPIVDPTGRVIGALYVGVSQAAFEQVVADIRQAVLAVAVIASGVLLLCTLALTRLGLRPLKRIGEAARQLGSGMLNLNPADLQRADEIGTIGRALAAFEENSARVAQLQAAQKEEEAAVARRRHAEMQALAGTFETSVKRVVDEVARAASQLEHSSDALSHAATDTTEATGRVADQAQEAASSSSAVADASRQLLAAIADTALKATQSAAKAQEAEQRSGETRAVMQTLAESAERIGEVVTMISTIAGQTNLLALNATIEAARAGEAGRGFSIVASEVKTLAGQTTKATQEIGQQIEGIQSATAAAVAAIGAIAGSIEEISGIARAMAEAVEAQRSVVGEINRSTNEIASATKAVSTSINTVRQGVGTTAASAEESRRASEGLSHQADVLETEVGRFLATVQAA